ncbi:flagellar filament capping protein FliD [Halomonas chromatireducens]|uniref:Flagellar hook-associated protein 2 n=1 Tax=Halomonas chromatireducens TaxID=507626 RepID=A0A0X8HFR8_9GAMM|nr:flagellar filament capping protein FliD [Halomonas chromatireducens]AMD01830.1 Flagellar hook-associated protein 2 [Halomonas chromatireducens]
MTTITSLGIGSGLDLNGLLDQLNAAERGKLEPIKLQQKSHQARISAYGKLQGALATFQSAAAKLNDSKFFQSVGSNVTGSGVKAAASAAAQPGRFDVAVKELARAQSVATGGFAEGAKFGGELTMTVGTGDKAKAVSIDLAPNSSLSDLRDAINAKKAGVTASIVNDGDPDSPYRLVLTANATGENAAIQSVALGGENGFSFDLGAEPDAAGSMSQVVAAQNAVLEVNGIRITSQSNQVKGAIQGVTLDLSETTAEGSSVTVVVERNTLAIREAVSGFVKAYNDMRSTISGLTKFNADTGDAGELLGDNTLRTVENRMRSVLAGGVGEGELRMLSDIGISLQRDGKLKLDEDRLSNIVANQPEALSAFFAGQNKAGGMAGKLNESLDQMLGDRGLLDNAKRGLETRLSSLADRFERMERSIEKTIDRYRIQFGQLDSMIATMNQTSDYLFQQFDMMNAQLGRKK